MTSSLQTVNGLVDVAGVPLAVRRLVHPHPLKATTLVFLHDSLGSIELWRDFPQRMTERSGLDVLAYDRQGHGRSAPFTEPHGLDYMERQAAVLGALLERVDIGSAVLFGHSTGGSIALIAAALFPGVVRGVITEGSHVLLEEPTLQGIREAKAAYQNSDIPQKLARYHFEKTQAVHDAWTETWLAPWFESWNIEHFLPRIQCPVLAIHGSEDEFGTEAQPRAIERGAPHGRALLLEGCGHNPHRQARERVEAEVMAFLGQLELS